MVQADPVRVDAFLALGKVQLKLGRCRINECSTPVLAVSALPRPNDAVESIKKAEGLVSADLEPEASASTIPYY